MAGQAPMQENCNAKTIEQQQQHIATYPWHCAQPYVPRSDDDPACRPACAYVHIYFFHASVHIY